jgi:hypothetical protein
MKKIIACSLITLLLVVLVGLLVAEKRDNSSVLYGSDGKPHTCDINRLSTECLSVLVVKMNR